MKKKWLVLYGYEMINLPTNYTGWFKWDKNITLEIRNGKVIKSCIPPFKFPTPYEHAKPKSRAHTSSTPEKL